MRTSVLLGTVLLAPWLTACSSVDGEGERFGTSPDGGVDASVTDAPIVDPDAPSPLPEAGDGPSPPVESGSDAPGADADPSLPPDCDLDVYHQYACCVFQGVNEFRQLHGVGLVDYVWDPQTAEVAQWYTELMRDTGVFAHGVDGRKCGSRMSYFGVEWTACGENLARNTYDDWQESCASVIDQWAGSTAGHREAMLEAKWTYAGVGVAEGNGWWWVTMNFREP